MNYTKYIRINSKRERERKRDRDRECGERGGETKYRAIAIINTIYYIYRNTSNYLFIE